MNLNRYLLTNFCMHNWYKKLCLEGLKRVNLWKESAVIELKWRTTLRDANTQMVVTCEEDEENKYKSYVIFILLMMKQK